MDESFPQARQFCKILFLQLSFTLIQGWTVRKVMGGAGGGGLRILRDARVFFIQCKVEIFFFFYSMAGIFFSVLETFICLIFHIYTE